MSSAPVQVVLNFLHCVRLQVAQAAAVLKLDWAASCSQPSATVQSLQAQKTVESSKAEELLQSG
jgi:hypothetical protein